MSRPPSSPIGEYRLRAYQMETPGGEPDILPS
jgi:hypothetical protein